MKESVPSTPLLMRNRLTHPCAFIFLMCCVTVLVGCGRSQGKKTFEFLTAEREVIENTKVELRKCPKPKPPPPPDFSEAQNRTQRARIEKAYRVAMGRYLSAVIQTSQQMEHVLNEAETKISRLDSSGIGDDAVSLTKDYEHMFGDKVQVCVEVRAVAVLEQAELRQNIGRQVVLDFLIGIVDAATTENLAVGAGVFLKHVSSDMKREMERDQELQSHYANLQAAVTELEHYQGEVITKRSELVTSYRARFPEYDWSSFLPNEEQAAEQTHISQYEQTAVQAQNAPAISAASEPGPKPKRHQYTGDIASIDSKAGTVIVKKGDADSKTFKIGDKTTYGTVDKKEAALTDINVGDKVTVHYTEEDGVLTAHHIGPPSN